jgi:hypothetical protein
MIEGVSIPILHGGHADFDELLREAVRVALRIDTSPPRDDYDELHQRIRTLIRAYLASPEGKDEDPAVLMVRLAAGIADVVPLEDRKRLVSAANSGSE